MKKTLIVFWLCGISFFANALTLEGEWQSDKQKTLEWNKKNRIVSEEYLSKLALILGHNHIYYGDSKVCNYFDSFKINEKDSGGYALPESSFKVIAENKFGFVIEETLGTKEKVIYMLIFESENLFYGVNLNSEDYGHPGNREYFSRVVSSVRPKWGQKSCYPL